MVRVSLADVRKELRGFDLVCSGCKIDDQPCHGDVLLEYANSVNQEVEAF